MTREIYKEKAATSQGRKELREIMLKEIKAKFENLVNGAPESNKEKLKSMFNVTTEKMYKIGISDLYDFFAGEHLTLTQFLGYAQDLYTGKLYK